MMKITNPFLRVTSWTFVLGTLFLNLGPPPATAVDLIDDLFSYWDDRYVTGVDELIPFFPPPLRPRNSILDTQVLAKATPDECFYDIGDSNNTFSFLAPPDPDTCYASNGAGDGESGQVNPGKLKVNQAYVWGLAKAGNGLWFGTGPNTHCLVLGTYLESLLGLTPTINDNYACEFGESKTAAALIGQGLDENTAASIGDWRPPQIFVYDTLSTTLTDKTGLVYAASLADQQRLASSLGIRSAGALDNVVILGGPGFAPGEGGQVVNLFAFNAQTGDFIASTSLTDYTNIRKWLVIDGVLYTAVGGGASGGAVLKWVGTEADPFSNGTNGFEVVGTLDATGAELALHGGRLFVSTWPGSELAAQGEAGIWMSPVILAGGLTNANADEWIKVWKVSDYEPDPVTARTYGGGALASFGGYLYWGTMNVPLLSTVAHYVVYQPLIDAGIYPDDAGDTSTTRFYKAFLATHRPISIFRGRNFETGTPEIALLYGLNQMWTFNPPAAPAAAPAAVGLSPGWNLIPNNMGGGEPLYGQAGFDNFYNNYTWTMAVFNGKLYVGSMDFSILFADLAGNLGDVAQYFPRSDLGADLMRFDSATGPATGENFNGVGNYYSYGIRTMVSDDSLYLGMANPMNLRTNPADAQGGWELIKAVEALVAVSGDSGGGCFISAAGLKDRFQASPIFAILVSIGAITVICGLGIAILRKKTPHNPS